VTPYVLDTSVAVAWYLPEAFSAAAGSWQARALRREIHLLAPHLHWIEFANVLRTYVRRGELEAQLAEEIFSLHLEAPVSVVAPRAEGLLRTALDYETTVYDATFILLALEQRAPLLTAERTTTPWVVRLGELAVTVA
jgi:predicted nucleic acid-binding protein